MRHIKGHGRDIVVILIAMWFGAVSFFAVELLTSEPEYDPWGDFTTQTVVHGEDGIISQEVPGVEHVFSIAETEQITTTGIKCLNDEQTETISVGGVVNWFMVIPPGFAHQSAVYEGVARMNPGCTSYRYVNTIPNEVREEVEKKLETEPYVVMNVQGYTVPYVDGKEDGVRATWSTENFAFIK